MCKGQAGIGTGSEGCDISWVGYVILVLIPRLKVDIHTTL